MDIKTNKTLLSLVVSTAIVSSLSAQNNEEIINSIMKLRGDVESLYTQIEENKQQYTAQMKSFSMQITDTEAQINRKDTSIKLAHAELEKVKVKIAESASNNSDLKPLIYSSIDLLKKAIKEGIPFKITERIADLDKIKSQLDEGLVTEEKALSLIWASYDDTLRVTKEIGLFKQNIMLKGETVLAKIAKLGSIMMFFSTPKDEVGYVVKKADGYEYKVVTDPEDIKKIVALFDALQKQLKTGYFTLPNALVLMENK
jgi:regulator of replication initiation timing